MGVPVRGVQEIKTLAAILGTGAHSNERHVRQFQLASLELERTRRTREKRAALRRIGDIDARLGEIDSLIHKHQEALGQPGESALSRGEAVAQSDGEARAEGRRVLRY